MVESPLLARALSGSTIHSNRLIAHESSPTLGRERKQIGLESLLCAIMSDPVTQ